MTRVLVPFLLLLLAACGADGEPETPPPPPGVTLSGSVEFGVAGTF
ncbi:argininosuccinate lyase [Rhodobacterales bacterium HKCCE3408]|nr:argininosuccinate lyase [Rhodobacterales bacterium HKCCE3408]